MIIVGLQIVELDSWLRWMWPKNYIQSLSIFPTLLSVSTVLVSLNCEYMYHGKRRLLQTPSWPDTIQILPYAWNCFLVIKMVHAMTKAQGWGRGKKDWIQHSFWMRRGTLILLFWDYIAGLLGHEWRCKSHSQSPKLKLRSQLLSTTT